MSIHARFHVPLSRFALDVDLRFEAAGVTAILGPSGSGKTTLLRCFAGLTRDPNGELRVRDHGRGYDGDASRLGRLFLRGDASRGTGVGLYLVRVLMERMRGGVEFANASGGGFVVTLVFPADS